MMKNWVSVLVLALGLGGAPLAAQDLSQGFESDLAQARAAWQQAGSRPERFAAAFSRASALTRQKRWLAAQTWLRIAAQLAPTENAKALAGGAQAALRRASPIRLDLTAQISPSSNVNNGSSERTFGVFQLPEADQALSGLTYGAAAQLRYRVAQSSDSARWVHLRASGSGVRLSDDAKDLAPDARNKDYSQTQIAAGMSGSTRIDSERAWAWRAEASHMRLAGEAFETRGTATWRMTHVLGAQDSYSTSVTGWVATRPSGDDHRKLVAGLSRGGVLGSGRWSLGATMGRSASDAAYLDYSEVGLNGQWVPTQRKGMMPDLGLALSGRWHPYNIYSRDKRHDRRLTLTAAAPVPGVEAFGFQPFLTVRASRNLSDVSVYRSESLGVGLSLRSQF